MRAPEVGSTRRSYAGWFWVFATMASTTCAQWTPAPLALKLPDSLVFATSATVTNTTLVWHPVNQRYYSLRVGNAGFPLHTWLPTGGASIAQTTAGFDTRGLWYNPATGGVERNGFGGIGWGTLDVDGALNAVNTFSVIFTGALQPNVQSMGVFEPATNSVLFYSAGNVQVRDRATGAVVQTLPLSGTSLAQVSPDCMIYTGQLGYEIGLLDYVNKRVLFFDRATGVYSGVSQLPASAVTAATYRLGYTNDRFWLFNSSTKTWNAYCLWTLQCSILLPVALVEWSAACAGRGVDLSWATASERNSSHFIVERSADAYTWEAVGEVGAAGHSQQVIEYAWRDDDALFTPERYYRLRQVDRDCAEELFHTLGVSQCGGSEAMLTVQPNPTTDACTVHFQQARISDGPLVLQLADAYGREIQRTTLSATDTHMQQRISLDQCAAGTYHITIRTAAGAVIAHSTLMRL
jgi:hypothetical protein